jgi:hypothetical protein
MDKFSIWNESQNKPTLIVRDLQAYAPANVIYESLLRRGVFKWLSARRKLIKLKNIWRERITQSLQTQKNSTGPDVNYWRGYRRGIEECRKEVRIICHGERWEASEWSLI